MLDDEVWAGCSCCQFLFVIVCFRTWVLILLALASEAAFTLIDCDVLSVCGWLDAFCFVGCL